MTVFDFDDRNRAKVSEVEFMDYLLRTAYHDDYTREERMECLIDDNDWRMCNCLVYYNSGGCRLALYNRDFNYGQLL